MNIASISAPARGLPHRQMELILRTRIFFQLLRMSQQSARFHCEMHSADRVHYESGFILLNHMIAVFLTTKALSVERVANRA